MMVLCNDIVITEYDRTRSGLRNEPVVMVMKHDTNITEE